MQEQRELLYLAKWTASGVRPRLLLQRQGGKSLTFLGRFRFLFLNQTRQKIGVTFGSNLTTTGGTALKFYASVRMEVRRIGAVKEGDRHVGNRTRVKVVKNKLAPPFREALFDIVYGKGVHREAEVLDLAVEQGHVKQKGSWFAMGEQRLGQGRAVACQWLAENSEVCDELAQRCLAQDKQQSRAA